MTTEYVLRAMVRNYAKGHIWDHMDSTVCQMAAEEIAHLRKVIARKEQPVEVLDKDNLLMQMEAEIIEQCRINGMGAERELALLGQIERQSAALKLARQVLMSVKETSSSTRLRRIVDEPLAAIHEALKGE